MGNEFNYDENTTHINMLDEFDDSLYCDSDFSADIDMVVNGI